VAREIQATDLSRRIELPDALGAVAARHAAGVLGQLQIG
jgi:HSP20 family molecular chaperone IbpA